VRRRRALLYVPADSRRKAEKAAGLGADCVCLDLEDGVALSQKSAAREAARLALAELDFGRSERLVRLNAYGSGLEGDDLEATIEARPDGYLLPKTQSAEAVQWLDERLRQAEAARGWPPGGIAVIAMIESALAVVNLREICAAADRLQAVIFGAEDLASDIGAARTPAAWEVFYARSAVVTHAAAAGRQAIDMVRVDYVDTEGLAQEARQGAEMGFAGKQAIHPNQIEVIQVAFTPSAEAVAHARRVVAAYADHAAAGRGAFALDGKMVDAPVVKAAERVLERAGEREA
jgi:citrate lyase beta subunit